MKQVGNALLCPAKTASGSGPYTPGTGLNFLFVDGHGEFLKQTGTLYCQSECALYKGHTPTEWPFTFGLTINGE